MSAVFRVAVRVLFRLDVRDTQTGLKVYRGDVVTPARPAPARGRFAIDVEILVAANRDRSARDGSAGSARLAIVEAPVRIVERAQSTVSSRRALSTATGLARIFWRDHVALGYQTAARAPAGVAAAT
jgi:hypothetical protein